MSAFQRSGLSRLIAKLLVPHYLELIHRFYYDFLSTVSQTIAKKLPIFTVLRQRLSAPEPGNAARCARYRKSDRPLDTSRRSPAAHKPFPANPKLSPFRQAPDGCQQTLS